MGSQVFHHYPPEFLSLLVDTIPRLCKSKKDVLTFFRGAGVEQESLADLEYRVSKDAANINKYEIARTVLVRLNDSGDSALRPRREVVKRVVEFEDFSRCWPNDQMEARGLVSKARELVNIKDSVTRLQQDYKLKLEEQSKKRQEEQRKRVEQLDIERQKKRELSAKLISLYKEENPHKRGKELEVLLNKLFECEKILIRESFTINGENNEGVIQQIDGAIEVNSYLYLVEMKWWQKPLSPKDVSQHVMRLFQRNDARGVFISASGYTEAAILDIQKVLSQRSIVLFTLKELALLLERDDSFESLLKSKVEFAQLDGKLIYDV